MPILHMTVDVVRGVQVSMLRYYQELSVLGTRIADAVDEMAGTTWVGPGAEQYLQDFRRWASTFQACLRQLETDSHRLATEIDEWEHVTGTF